MELRQLRHFLTVVDTGSFSRAAALSNLTPQALSKSIAALEQALGVQLLDRTSRRVALTRFGEMLHAHALTIIAEASQFQRQLDTVLGQKGGRLLIGAGPTSAGRVIAPTVDALRRSMPRLHVSVIDGAAETLVPMLLTGRLDIVICIMNEEIDDPLVEQETLYHEPLAFIVGRDHPLAARSRVPLVETIRHPWLVGWNGGEIDRRVLLTMDRLNLKAPVRRVSTTSLQFARSLLVSSDYVAVLPRSLFMMDVEAKALAELDVDVDASAWRRPVKLLYRRKGTQSPGASAFLETLRTVIDSGSRRGGRGQPGRESHRRQEASTSG
jgi:DNA-binding transcriptional LysR family regulator